MGSSQSSQPRSVSIENHNPLGIIDVSDDVVKRLKQGISQQVRENSAAAESAKKAKPPPSPPPPQQAPKKSTPPPPSVPSATAPTIIYQSAPPIYVPAGGVSLTASDVRREMEAELQKNDETWRQRMTHLEETLKKTNSILESEYSAAVEDVRKRFVTASPVHQLPPCQDLKAQLLTCYRANPGETLKCTQEVAAFRSCVDEHRIKKLDADQLEKPTAEAAKPKAIAKAG